MVSIVSSDSPQKKSNKVFPKMLNFFQQAASKTKKQDNKTSKNIHC